MAQIEKLLNKAGKSRALAPEHWAPAYCGDVGLRIRADGVWLYQNSPIGRPELIKLFSSVLRREADGRHYLVTPAEKVDVTVDDAPFVAVEMDVMGGGREQALDFRTNVGDRVACGPAHPLRFSAAPPEGGLKPYFLVRRGLEALLTRPLYYELVELGVTEKRDGRDVLGIWSRGVFFALAGS